MKTLFLSCLISIASLSQHTGTGSTVYISTGNKAYAYHARKSCRTIKHCVEEGHVKEISIEEAKKIGRRPCKVCAN